LVDFVTQDMRIDDLEDVAYLKQRVTKLEEKIKKIEILLFDSPPHKEKHRNEAVASFLSFSTVEKQNVFSDTQGG
jgi:hypothetical protein